jgi:hypothetical protein
MDLLKDLILNKQKEKPGICEYDLERVLAIDDSNLAGIEQLL